LRAKRWIELARAALLPVIYLMAVLAEHSGKIDDWRGLDQAKLVVDNFHLSYAPDASKPVYPSNPGWKPLIALIRKYSRVKLRTDKEPQTIARTQATLSAVGPDQTSEWTAASTPVVVFYQHWPGNTGKILVHDEDFTTVGSIGDLQNWIVQSKSDFHFLLHDIILGVLALALGYSQWHLTHVAGLQSKKKPAT
jgi:hypothetical protein